MPTAPSPYPYGHSMYQPPCTCAPEPSAPAYAPAPSVQMPYAAQPHQSTLHPMLEARLIQIMRESHEPTWRALKEMKSQLERFDATINSHEEWLAEWGTRAHDVLVFLEDQQSAQQRERAHDSARVEASAQEHERKTRADVAAQGDAFVGLPPLVDHQGTLYHGTLYHGNGVVIGGSAARCPCTHGKIIAEDAIEEQTDLSDLIEASREVDDFAEVLPVVEAASAQSKEEILRIAMGNVVWPPRQERHPAPGHALEQVHPAPLSFPIADPVDIRDDDDQEWESRTPTVVGEAQSPSTHTSRASSAVDAGEAAALRVRRLEIKLLKAQLRLAHKRLEQLIEDGEDLDFDMFEEFGEMEGSDEE